MWLEIENSSIALRQNEYLTLNCTAGKKLTYGHWPWHGNYSMLAYHINSLPLYIARHLVASSAGSSSQVSFRLPSVEATGPTVGKQMSR